MDLPVIAALGLAALVGVALIFFRRGGALGQLLREAARSGDVAPLLAAIDRHPAGRQPNVFNQAIRQLWDNYERETAAMIVRALAERHAETRIAQYWLDQVQRVEPELAARVLDHGFLERHFRPEIAARCGQFG